MVVELEDYNHSYLHTYSSTRVRFDEVQNESGVSSQWNIQRHAERMKQNGNSNFNRNSKGIFYMKICKLTFTLSTQSICRFSGIVVIQLPFVRRKNIPCSAANHKLYSPKFCRSKNISFNLVSLPYPLPKEKEKKKWIVNEIRKPHQAHSGRFHLV